MIYGLTHSETGIPRQRLAVAWKVSIGIPGTDGSKFPQKIDHFRIVAKDEKGDWVEDVKLQKKLINIYCKKVAGDENNPDRFSKLREFDIVFLEDPQQVQLSNGQLSYDLESIFRTELAWWTQTERKCYGNGKTANRSVTAVSKEEAAAAQPHERYVPWAKCGDGCPEYEKGLCKPTATLGFILKDEPVMGSIVNFKTTSYESIQRIQGSLLQILQTTGGRLRGIPLKLVLRPGKTTYTNPQGTRTKGNAFFVNVEFRHEDWANLVPRLIEQSGSYALNSKRALLLTEQAGDDVFEVVDVPEAEQAAEMVAEFFPENAETEKQEPVEDDGLDAICKALQLNSAQKDTMLGVFKGDVAESVKWATEFYELAKTNEGVGSDIVRIHQLFSRALLQPGAMKQMFEPAKEVAVEKPTPKKSTKATPKPAEQPPAGKQTWSF